MSEVARGVVAMHQIGDGPVVVLLHAFPCDARMWLPQARDLATAGWRAVVVDLPGFGGSPGLGGPPSLDAVAERVVDELAVRGIDRFVLGGVSLGGYVAMAIVRAHPDLVAALVLCDTKATADTEAARANRERLAAAVEADPANVGRILEQAVLPGLLAEHTFAQRPEVVETVRAWVRAAEPASVAWYQRAMADRPDSRPALTQAGLPTLVVRGEHDALSGPDEAALLVGTSAEARLVTVPAAGHLAGVEDPAAVSAAMLEFLALVRGSQTS